MTGHDADDLTERVLAAFAGTPDPRRRLLFAKLVEHLHAFVRETALAPAEWSEAVDWLARTGQTCTPERQEFVLASDVLGVSTLVDALAHAAARGATDSSVLGPFHTAAMPARDDGASIARDARGREIVLHGRVLAVGGAPIAGATIDVWETDADGFYDVQYAGRDAPDCRGRFRSGGDGRFTVRGVAPVSYAIPVDGPVGELLAAAARPAMRPAHVHVRIVAEDFVSLTTALYARGDPHLASDAVFGVKPSLVVSYDDGPIDVEFTLAPA